MTQSKFILKPGKEDSFRRFHPWVFSGAIQRIEGNPVEGDVVTVGALKFEVIETPGHTVGGVCYLERENGVLFSGDTLFAGAIGRSDHPGGDYDVLMKSIFEKIMTLDGAIEVHPGHGPSTDIATERMTNPFLLPFNEPYTD